MKKFNLELALAGEPVIDKEGNDVRQVHQFNFNDGSVILVGITKGVLQRYFPSQLSMKPIIKNGWVNIYTYNGKLMTSAVYSTEQRALNQKDRNSSYIKTILINDSK